MATMNSTKEMRNGTKAQKKSIKANKKQQLKQQQSQQKTDAEATTTTTCAATNPAQYSVNKLTGKTMKMPVNTSNNNNNIITNNNNINQKLKLSSNRPLNTTQSSMSLPGTIVPPGYENAPKLERSNSFSLRCKLSKLISSITGSKENLTKADDENATPFKFTRSRSMILLRRSNRRSLIEPQLEQLSEETDPTSPSSPRKNSMEITDLLPPPANRSFTNSLPVTNGATTTITPHRHSILPLTSTPVEEENNHVVHLRRKPSNISLPVGEVSGEPFNPIANFQRRRSNTLLASFKSTIATITGDKKKEKLNPKWSASLQSLQAIDNMVSYENMSFIDYDKFNGYEKQLERQLSTLSLRTEQNPPLTPTTINHSPLSVPVTVVRRRKSSSQSRSRGSFNFDTDYEHNLDKPRNVYRDSLDSRKLERLNDFSRNSFILDKEIVDWLNLEDGSPRKRRLENQGQQVNVDTVDAAAVVQVSL